VFSVLRCQLEIGCPEIGCSVPGKGLIRTLKSLLLAYSGSVHFLAGIAKGSFSGAVPLLEVGHELQQSDRIFPRFPRQAFRPAARLPCRALFATGSCRSRFLWGKSPLALREVSFQLRYSVFFDLSLLGCIAATITEERSAPPVGADEGAWCPVWTLFTLAIRALPSLRVSQVKVLLSQTSRLMQTLGGVIFLTSVVGREQCPAFHDDAVSPRPAFAGLQSVLPDVTPSNVDLTENVMLASPSPGSQVTIMVMEDLTGAARSESLRALNELVIAVERHAGTPA
jgi:hypothetical protein